MAKYPRHTPKTVLITGATGDFGKAFVRRFSALGCRLILCGRDAKKLAALAKTIKTPHQFLAFDMTDTAGMARAFKSLPKGFQKIDVLINNAGLALGLEPAHKVDIADWETMIAVNITGLVRLTRLVLPGMAQRKSGHIINIGSTAGNYPYPGGNVYGASKAFVKQFSQNLRADLRAPTSA